MAMTINDPAKKARLEKKSARKMQKAKATWSDAEYVKKEAMRSNNPADAGDAEQLYRKASRLESKAKKLKSKSMMKTGGMVNSNAKVSALKSAGSKGVKSGVNATASASKVAKGRVGGTSAAPKTAMPKAQKGGELPSVAPVSRKDVRQMRKDAKKNPSMVLAGPKLKAKYGMTMKPTMRKGGSMKKK